MLLKNSKIKMTVNDYAHKQILIDYNNKKRFINKTTYKCYLRRTILNKFTEVVQFKVERNLDGKEESLFKRFKICKKTNGTLDFTEILLNNNWQDNYIDKMFIASNY